MSRYCYRSDEKEDGDTPPYCSYCHGIGVIGGDFAICKLAKDRVIMDITPGSLKSILSPDWCPLDNFLGMP